MPPAMAAHSERRVPLLFNRTYREGDKRAFEKVCVREADTAEYEAVRRM